jgi:hypothetical protein|tara:strand:+ start:10027 stop:10365 length:339 start_codon:yes stop_codon:yes gene_type:complete
MSLGHTLLSTMLVTGIILAPVALATPAVQDLINLRTVINAAANTIGDTKNPNRGWGFGGSGGVMGTADLVNNVTNTVLGMKFQVDTNKVSEKLSLLVEDWADDGVDGMAVTK